jgi:hypothetical protein
MASEPSMRRYRKWYAKLLCYYPKDYRERFGEPMQQTFNDLCRERRRGLFGFVLWMFAETAAGIIRENARNIMRCSMKRDTTTFLTLVKHCGIFISILMVAGIAGLMILNHWKGDKEDIAGIVASALFVAIVSGVAATVAAVLQKRARRASA